MAIKLNREILVGSIEGKGNKNISRVYGEKCTNRTEHTHTHTQTHPNTLSFSHFEAKYEQKEDIYWGRERERGRKRHRRRTHNNEELIMGKL